ncbi:MAG: hypothetical protein KF855_18200 [Acidobacteria bacterium]|nr:hypothetical protein [Acidobacteriota bacterium]
MTYRSARKTGSGRLTGVAGGNVVSRSRPLRPAAGVYYFTLFVICGFIFTVLWLIFYDDVTGDLRYLIPTLSAAAVFIAGVLFREILLQRAHAKALREQRRLERNFALKQANSSRPETEKLSLEQHEKLLREIRKKSEAARVLGHLPEGHKEVSELSERYLHRISAELPRVQPGSPRLGTFKKEQRRVRELHRFHLLRWTEIVTRSLIQEAGAYDNISERLSAARKAQEALEFAVGYYPTERDLLESQELLNEFIVSIEITGIMECARAADEAGEYTAAAAAYREALSRLTETDVKTSDISLFSEEIETELKKLEYKISEEENT